MVFWYGAGKKSPGFGGCFVCLNYIINVFFCVFFSGGVCDFMDVLGGFCFKLLKLV